jgi:hypothetical protein
MECQECHGSGFKGMSNDICDKCYGVGRFYIRPVLRPEDEKIVKSANRAIMVFAVLILAVMLYSGQIKLRWLLGVAVTFLWMYLYYAGSVIMYTGIKIGRFVIHPYAK